MMLNNSATNKQSELFTDVLSTVINDQLEMSFN